MESSDGHIGRVSLTGDLFFCPAQRLTDLVETESVITRFYPEQGVESPGVTPADCAQVLG